MSLKSKLKGKVKVILYKILKKEMPVIELTSAMMIVKANAIVDGALSMFTTAIKEVENANAILAETDVKNDVKKKSLQDEMDRVLAEQEKSAVAQKANLALKEKLSQFAIK
jgi:hypothetical protein